MEIKSEIEVSFVENINSCNVDGASDNQDICKFEEDEVEELKFESNCNSEDRNEECMDSDDENLAIPVGEEHPSEETFGVEGSKDINKLEEIDTVSKIPLIGNIEVSQPREKMLMLLHSRNRSKRLTSMTIDIMVVVLDDPHAHSSR